MSEVKLNLVDARQTLVGTVHGSIADACVAALSAEPETIAELEAALARYVRPINQFKVFGSFRPRAEIDIEPWDAGVVSDRPVGANSGRRVFIFPATTRGTRALSRWHRIN